MFGRMNIVSIPFRHPSSAVESVEIVLNLLLLLYVTACFIQNPISDSQVGRHFMYLFFNASLHFVKVGKMW
jgi:hypothetical protein